MITLLNTIYHPFRITILLSKPHTLHAIISSMNIILALDIGGTHMRAAAFPEGQQTPSAQTRISTYANGQTSLNRLIQLVRDMTSQGDALKAIGIAVPGAVDPRRGIILTSPNLPEWQGIPIPQTLQAATGAPTFLGNDANLAAVGEWQFGAGRGYQDLVYLTISTGIGGGVISDGRLLVGSQGLGAELGHVTIDPNGPICSCGHRGHLEAFASGTGIAAFVAEQLSAGRPSALSGKPDAKAIALAAKNGDELATDAFQRAGYYLGLGIANYLMIFNPSIVILGGGVSQVGELLITPVRKTIEKSVLSPHYLEGLTITQAALGDDSGLYGAYALARDSVNRVGR